MTETTHPPGHELQAFVDNEMDASATKLVAEHCAGCATCRSTLSELERVRELLAAAPAPELNRTVWHRIERARRREAPLSRSFKVALTATCAAGIVLGLQLGPVKLKTDDTTAARSEAPLESVWGSGSGSSLLGVYTNEAK